MTEAIVELVDVGLGAAIQDLGRRGWKRLGVPPGGALDDHAARWANRLLDNPLNAPVLELLLHGATLRALRPVKLAVAGAAVAGGGTARWRAWDLEEGEKFTVPPPRAGLWTYVGTSGGFMARQWFGSVSALPRGGLGEPLTNRTVLHRQGNSSLSWPASIGQRWLDPTEQRDYAGPPPFQVWRGPQWDLLSTACQKALFEQAWHISPRIDRTGYRLEGATIPVPPVSLTSEPLMPGSIQLPPDGAPIVTMRDGPTVGGYPVLGLVDPAQLSWLCQCRPGQEIRFVQHDNVGTAAVHNEKSAPAVGP